MKDQAEKLREIVRLRKNLPHMGKKKTEIDPEETPLVNKSRIIAITSGKGGVGKTNFSINLGITFARMGKKVVVLDADLGLANVDVILGKIPKYTFVDLIESDLPIERVMAEGPEGIRVISGISGAEGIIEMSEDHLKKLEKRFEEISGFADIILIDTGAGISKSVLSFVVAADEVIIVTTPEPTSITDAYAVMKAIGKEHGKNEIQLMVNRVKDRLEGEEVYHKLKRVGNQFLGLNIKMVGFLREDVNVGKSVYNQSPFVVEYPNGKATRDLVVLAEGLLKDSTIEKNGQEAGFIQKVFGLFK